VVQVPGAGGALAVYILPRYLLHNTLDVPIHYRQQGEDSTPSSLLSLNIEPEVFSF
jgi:hypothetical protein